MCLPRLMVSGPVPVLGSNLGRIVSMLEQPEHKDLIGRKVGVGDFVAFPQHKTLYVGRIIKLNKQMLRLQRITQCRFLADEVNKYSKDCVLLPSRDMDFYLLKVTLK